ncbi:hypothetical protein SY89_00307 [Halolamina pelagica]|uniref:Uncharacterized protein n=1 Tax=Halolamina pelagica TaxID=699431 RepID=A0A0P7FSF4_9EURY|nr:hypothetical protein SY89_00307 [Halolamina pelagica]
MDELATIPGVSDGRAGDIVVSRPYDSVEEAGDAADVDLSLFATAGDADVDVTRTFEPGSRAD